MSSAVVALSSAATSSALVPLLANGSQATGPSTWLLVLAGISLTAGVGLLAMGRSRPPALALAGLGIALAVAAFVIPGLDEEDRPDAQVQISEPQGGSEVTAGEPVKVEVNVVGGEIATSPTDEDGGHLHLYVDDKLLQMPYTTEAEVILEPGSHVIRVEFVDHLHLSYDPPIDATVEVNAA